MAVDDGYERWREAYDRSPKRDAEFITQSSADVEPLYTARDIAGLHEATLGHPGE